MNAPGFFSLIWRVAEPMLSPTTRRKIRLLHNKQVLTAAFMAQGLLASTAHIKTTGTLHMLPSMSAPAEDSMLDCVYCVMRSTM